MTKQPVISIQLSAKRRYFSSLSMTGMRHLLTLTTDVV